VFYRGGGGAEGTKTHEKLILLEADLANHGHVSRDLMDEEILGDMDGGSARGAGHPCLGKMGMGRNDTTRWVGIH